MTQRKKTVPKEEELDKYAQELQELLLEQIRKKYSDVVINRWQNPRNFETSAHPPLTVSGPSVRPLAL